MGYSAKILADSLSPLGDRLTTFEITFPRIVLSEFNTHRMFSRNSASSRAIPVKKMLTRVLEDPFVPVYWGKNQPGMSAAEEVNDLAAAEKIWLEALADSVYHVIELQLGPDEARLLRGKASSIAKPAVGWFTVTEIAHLMLNAYEQPSSNDETTLNVHKQIANRLLEPWMWHTVIVTATEWSNFFALRTEASAQPEIRQIADMMHELYHEHEPKQLDYKQWHLPLVDEDEFPDFFDIKKARISTGRCCRVSYLTHDGKRDPQKDIELHDSLLKNGHMSPFEHAARPLNEQEKLIDPWYGNFYGWKQYRKLLENEADFSQVRTDLEGAWCEDCLAVHATRQISGSAVSNELNRGQLTENTDKQLVIRKV